MEYKISIIMPVFNVEDYLKDSIKSILRQTIGFENLEVIMVDDCSTDISGEIMEEYASKYDNITAIHLPRNSGAAGKPRNIGMSMALGKYLMFLDGDDYYNDDLCEKLYNKIVHEDSDIVFCNFTYIHENRKVNYPSCFGEIAEVKLNRIDDNPRLLTVPPSVWTKIFKTSFIKDNNIQFPESIPAQDLVFVNKAFIKASGIVYLNKYYGVNYNRIRDSKQDYSTSRSRNMKNLMKMLDAFAETFNNLKAYDKEDFFPYIFKGNLAFWLDIFIVSDTKSTERIELLTKGSYLFEELNKYDEKPEKNHLVPLFNSISQKRYDDAVLISYVIKDFIEKHIHFIKRQEDFIKKEIELTEKIVNLEYEKNKLQYQLNTEKTELSKYLTTYGFLVYKSNNIIIRSKNKLKNL